MVGARVGRRVCCCLLGLGLWVSPATAAPDFASALQAELRAVSRELAVSRRARLLAGRALRESENRQALLTKMEGESRSQAVKQGDSGDLDAYSFWNARCVALRQLQLDLRERRRSWRRSEGTIRPRQMPAVGAVEVPFRGAHGNGSWRDGIGIRVVSGELVRAAAPGTVAFVGELPAYGGVVVLDHGLRVFTVYGGLDPEPLAAGEVVSVGSTLGRPSPGGEGLVYFSVRRGRESLDPEGWRRERTFSSSESD